MFDSSFIRQKAVAAIIEAMHIRIRPTKNTMVSIAPMSIIVFAAANRRSPERFAMYRNDLLKYTAINRVNMNTIVMKGIKYIVLDMK